MKVSLEMPFFVLTMITRERTNLPKCASLQPEVPTLNYQGNPNSNSTSPGTTEMNKRFATDFSGSKIWQPVPMCISENSEPLYASVLQMSEWYFPLPGYVCRSPITSWHDNTDYPTLYFFNVMFDLKP